MENGNGRRSWIDKVLAVLITALLTVFLTWSATAATKADRSDVSALESKIDAQARQITDLRVMLAEMNGTLREIQRKLE